MQPHRVPEGFLPLLPLRNGVVFPGLVATLPVGRKRSISLVETLQEGDLVGIAVQRERDIDEPGAADLHPLGTLARVVKLSRQRGQHHRVVVEGLVRFRIAEVAADGFWQVRAVPVEEPVSDPVEARALAESLLETLRDNGVAVGAELGRALRRIDPVSNPGAVADVVAGGIGLSTESEVEILMTLDVVQRLRTVMQTLSEAKVLAEVKDRIRREVQGELSNSQREMFLRQQLKAIRKELGQKDDDEADSLRSKLEALDLPPAVREVVDRELGRLESMSAEQAEFNVTRRYLELIAELPWNARSEVKGDLNAVAEKLDHDHYGLADVKKRILEHLAVRKMTANERGAILCFVGPPGVGKTSLGQSIADATGRPLVRVALGGVRDEADIRGHRRTYIGALPGRILGALRRAKVKNPVLLLDEVDKLGQGWMGSPEAALLEVLDPEQNHTFSDHYLDLPFDLSEVFFLCTANNVEQLSAPLRDRLEIIDLEGYTSDEKLHIARSHLVPKQLERHGLGADTLELTDAALAAVVADYTREAGVRQLDREIAKICRAVTLVVARDADAKGKAVKVDGKDVPSYLGKTKFFNDVAERTSIVGVATGLAWTPGGGDILFIETSRMPGKGKLEITGQLGDVMKESARAALTYVRSHAAELHIEPGVLDGQDLHVHVPAGAVPKDGPSAGVTMFTALASLLCGRRVRSDTAMTGEATLRGRVLPVGGIKAKVLAAHRAGITRIILPKKNERDLADIPQQVLAALKVHLVEDMSEVLGLALEQSPVVPVTDEPGASRGIQA